MANTDFETNENHKDSGNIKRWSDLKDYLWNSKDGVYFGRALRPKISKPRTEQEKRAEGKRNLADWPFSTIFYVAFYFGLMIFFLILIGVFSVIADEIYPSVQGMESPLQFSPGLSYKPLPDHQSRLIRFIQGKPATYKVYTDHIRTFLEYYENQKQTGENFIDCSQGRPPNMLDKVCRFDVNKLGIPCVWQRDFGYDEGEPCLLFKLNRIYDWTPQVYSYPELLEAAPDYFDPEYTRIDITKPENAVNTYIGFSCEGRYEADRENIYNISYYPSEGISMAYYPYRNQLGYRSPLIMVKIHKPLNGVVITVICRAFAKNVRLNTNDELGSATFALLVD